MKKIVRLTEKDLNRIVMRVINEQESETQQVLKKGPHLNDYDDIDTFLSDYDTFRDSPEYLDAIDKRNKRYQKTRDLEKKRVRGSWSNDEELELQNIRSQGPKLNDYDKYEDWEAEFHSWRNEPRHQELINKKRKSY